MINRATVATVQNLQSELDSVKRSWSHDREWLERARDSFKGATAELETAREDVASMQRKLLKVILERDDLTEMIAGLKAELNREQMRPLHAETRGTEMRLGVALAESQASRSAIEKERDALKRAVAAVRSIVGLDVTITTDPPSTGGTEAVNHDRKGRK